MLQILMIKYPFPPASRPTGGPARGESQPTGPGQVDAAANNTNSWQKEVHVKWFYRHQQQWAGWPGAGDKSGSELHQGSKEAQEAAAGRREAEATAFRPQYNQTWCKEAIFLIILQKGDVTAEKIRTTHSSYKENRRGVCALDKFSFFCFILLLFQCFILN